MNGELKACQGRIKELWKDISPVSDRTAERTSGAVIDFRENPLDPHILAFCFKNILGFDVSFRSFEKTNYVIFFDYKGSEAYALDKKLEYSITIEEKYKAEFIELLRETKPILNEIFQLMAKDALERNEFTLINEFPKYTDKLCYDEAKIESLYEAQKDYEKNHKLLFSFIDDCETATEICRSYGWRINEEWRHLTYEIETYINDFYAYLEHLLTLLIPFSENFDISKPYQKSWTNGWTKKLEAVFGKAAVSGLTESLKRYKEIYRNRQAHGAFSNETEAYVQIDELGRYPLGIGRNYLKGFTDRGEACLSMQTYWELKELCNQLNGLAYSTYPAAMVIIESGLDIPVDAICDMKDIRTADEAKAFVDKEFACRDMINNMDR